MVAVDNDLVGSRSSIFWKCGNRRRIFRWISDHPGEHFRRIERQVDIGTGTLKYHLDKLMEAGLIVSERQGKYRLFFRAGVRRSGLYLTPAQRAMMEYVRDNPGQHTSGIAKARGCTARTAYYHLGYLADRGVLRGEKKGYRTVWYVDESVPVSDIG